MLSQKHTAVSTAVPASLSAVRFNPIPMSPAERLDFEAAINQAFLSGKAYQRKLKPQSVAIVRQSRGAA